MMTAGFFISAFAAVVLALLMLRERRRANRVERNLNRRLVAYEGRLRELNESPERVYHDFENMLEGTPEDRQAEEFESDVRYVEDEE